MISAAVIRHQTPMPSSVTAADPLTNNSAPIHKIAVNEDEKFEEIEVYGEENSEGSYDGDHKRDGTHILEPMSLEEHLRSGISTLKPVANPDTPVIVEGNDSCRISNFDERRGRNYSSLDGKRTIVLSDLQALRCDIGETITHEIQPFGQKVSAEFTEGGHQEVSQDLPQTSSRLDVRETWARSLTPPADSPGGNKRSADRCEFYSRGSKDTTEKPARDCFSDDLALSRVRCGENQRLKSDNDLHMHKDENPSSMPFRDIGRETLGCKSYYAVYGSSSPPLLRDDSLNKDSYRSEMLPSSSVLSSYKYQNEVPSYASALDDTSYKRTNLMLDYHHLPFLNRSVDRWPSYLTSSSSNLDPVSDQKVLDRSQEYCYSRSMPLHNKSSALPGCGTESFSWTDLSGDTEHSCYKTKVYFNDWETSVPFRPSTFLSQIIPPLESLYDPIRDSIEQTSPAVKDLSANERKAADRAIAHQENMNTSSKEEKHSRSVNPRGQKRKQSKLEKLGPSCEIDTDFRRDGSVNYESGVMKHFRATLVEFVKEFLKPTWHEGLLMKDAYKMIVKKAVDKIINSLTPDQIPDTTESINQYLSVSKSKVAKLIEGYVEKYGKS